MRWPERAEIEIIQVEPDDSLDSGRHVGGDSVSEHMRSQRQATLKLLPYQLCSSDICSEGCQSQVRRAGGEFAEAVAQPANEIWTTSNMILELIQ